METGMGTVPGFGAGTVPLVVVPLVVAGVLLAFVVHWITLARVDTAEKRLPLCRGAYLGMSAQLVLLAWASALVLNRAYVDRGQALPLMVAAGMTLSFCGDLFNLQFEGIRKRAGEPLFFGILCFAAAQLCYIAGFLSAVPLDGLIADGFFLPVLAALVVVPAVLFRFRVYDPGRPKTVMLAAFLYGFILGAMAAVAASAAIARGGTWYIVAAGALFFLLSDAIMGQTTIRGMHPRNEFQVPWITYLAAQGLIILGSALA